MVKDCMSNGHGFVIVFQSSHSNGMDTEILKRSYVEIIDFNNLPNGLHMFNLLIKLLLMI